ncbi:meiosis regulator and mRNA stability factor 1-like isoform X2 [Watersipora subatra]|uniref:meiosis regulator and mRNA stability factor 1-like isoform X2 n=1 Tax=Watersipora subatra TaxID=2589382 RepID=UPI00355AD984
MNGASPEHTLAIFWDIENCGVPKGKSPAAVAYCIREQFSSYGKEVEFLCVCDVTKEPPLLVSSLNDAQVTVVHVSNEHKNAADDKLKLLMRKFCDSHKPPVTLVLISGDVDFAADLGHMKNHHKYDIVLVHNKGLVKPALAYAANKVFSFDEVVKNAPEKDRMTPGNLEEVMHLVVIKGLPTNVDVFKIKARLTPLVNNTKGCIFQCTKKMAIASYSKSSHAARAAKRLQQQDLYGSKISAVYTTNASAEGFSGPMHPRMEQSGDQLGLTNLCSPSHSPRSMKRMTALGDFAQSKDFSMASLPIQARESCGEVLSHDVSHDSTCSQHNYVDFFKADVRYLEPADHSSSRKAAPVEASQQVTKEKKVNVFNLPNWEKSPTVETKASATATDAAVKFLLSGSSGSITVTALQDYLRSCMPVVDMEITHAGVSSYTLSVKVAANKAAYLEAICRDLLHQNQLLQLTRCRGVREPSMLRVEVAILLRELSGKCTSIKQLIEDYTQSFKDSITEEQLRTIQETVEVKEEENEAVVSLLATPSSNTVQPEQLAITPYCTRHCCHKMYSLATSLDIQLYVRLERGSFTRQLHALLSEHSGVMHLASFPFCYEGIYGRLVPCCDGGVLLDHLISSVKWVRIKTYSGHKVICYDDSGDAPLQHALGADLDRFASETVSLLNLMPNCQMSLAKFMLYYKFQFNRELKVEDFGCASLEELLAAIPHLVQVTGNELSLTSYGACYITDMLPDIADSEIQVDGVGENAVLSISDKGSSSAKALARQTCKEQLKKTRQFAYEVISLLKNYSECTMPFKRFIPAYHHHVGRQCRVADYGFSKLIELFDAISDVVSIIDGGEERRIALTATQVKRKLEEMVLTALIQKRGHGYPMYLSHLKEIWQTKYGVSQSQDFSFSLEDLMRQISRIAHAESRTEGDVVVLIDQSSLELLTCRCLDMLILKSNGRMKVDVFKNNFQHDYGVPVDLDKVKNFLYPAIEIYRGKQAMMLSLHPLLHAARRMVCLLNDYTKVEVPNFEKIYQCRFNDQPDCYNFTVMFEMLQSMFKIDRQKVFLRQGYIAHLAVQLVYQVGIYSDLTDWDIFFGEPQQSSEQKMSAAVLSSQGEKASVKMATLDKAGKALSHLSIYRSGSSE